MRYGSPEKASEQGSSVKATEKAHYRTTTDNFFPSASFNNARQRISSEKEPIE